MTEHDQPLLDVQNVDVHFRRRGSREPFAAVSGVNLAIDAGETVALVGESGSGKTTLSRVILGLQEPFGGRISFDGEDVTSRNREMTRRLSRSIQAVFQDPYSSLNPTLTIGKSIVEPLFLDRSGYPSSRARRERARHAMSRVGMPDEALDRYPAEFSGGQRQRIAIARALIAEPKLIVCDEPVSALDLSVQARVLNLLTSLQRELGLAYLFISHDLAVVRHFAHRVVVMKQGSVVESGSVGDVCDRPQHPYTRQLLVSAGLLETRAGVS